MFDLKWIRNNPDAFDKALARRGMAPHAAGLLELDEERRTVIGHLQEAQQKRNESSKLIGKAKASGNDQEATTLIAAVAEYKSAIRTGEETERDLNDKLHKALAELPNMPLDDVPDGEDETGNVMARSVGEKPAFDFQPKQHFELGEALGLMDFEAAARMSGARFVVLKGALARLERALACFMLDTQTGQNGYSEIAPPFLVRDEAVFGTAQLPKFADDLFRTENGYWLIPTSEVPLTNLVREQILDATELPLRFTALTPCFRSEAGSAGQDTRGMIRQHQFSKVEMVSITTPDTSLEELERMTGCAEDILQQLGLAYQVLTLCTGDMGFSARKTYDLEVWLPGQDRYREISSCSVCGDFQARRMNARYRAKGSKQAEFVHTLNGSGLAVGRALVAVMENNQNADGSITVPEKLHPYMAGLEVIEAAK